MDHFKSLNMFEYRLESLKLFKYHLKILRWFDIVLKPKSSFLYSAQLLLFDFQSFLSSLSTDYLQIELTPPTSTANYLL